MTYLRAFGTVVGASLGLFVAVGATVGACGGGGETTASAGSTGTGSGGGAASSSAAGMGGTMGTSGTSGTGGAATATSSSTGGMPLPGYDCSAAVGSVPPLKLTQVASGIKRPVLLKGAPGDNSRTYVVGQDGKIWIIKNGVVSPTPFLDISADVHQPSSGDERGLLGLAFHPKYDQNGRFFVYYTDTTNPAAGDQHLAEYKRSANDPDLADPKEVQTLFVEPDAEANHNGGMIEFSPSDGFLYVGMGDGGGAGDKHPTDGSPPGNGQSLDTRWGKLLRLDVDSATKPYGIPAGNMPGSGVTQEIWDYGLRNPWRFSFDACTSDLYIGDVGQGAWEEIDIEPVGQGNKNYGWRRYEGKHCYNPQACDLMDPQFTLPVVDYPHGPDCSVNGGFVYRGKSIPALRGTYFYGDYCTGNIWTLSWANGTAAAPILNADLHAGDKVFSSFGQDNLGEIYVLTLPGVVYRIDAN